MSGISARFAGTLGEFALDVAFEMAGQGVTALVGPSGCGKTTVLRCIAGLARLPGRLMVDGEVWQDETSFLPPHRRPVGFVFQDASLLPHLSVRRNLTFGLHRAAGPHAIAFDDVVEWLGLAALVDRSPAKLSGGERQRVALGRALLSQPRLLLLDEPLAGLDAVAKAEIAPYIERLHKELATPILYVSHDAEEVRRIADHLLVMNTGRIIEKVDDLQNAGDSRGRLSLQAAEAALAQMNPEEVRLMALTAVRARLKPSS
ncbi:MAG: fbpC [Caulobacteraceae bacterium]|nr:fbpC [Caulobacteraceae bacterium]